MRNLIIAVGTAAAALAGGCGPISKANPLGEPADASKQVYGLTKRFTPAGLMLDLDSRCKSIVAVDSCSPNANVGCQPDPLVKRDQEVACPPATIRLFSPWGLVYDAVATRPGSVVVNVDWRQADIDPLADGSWDLLSRGWFLSTNGERPVPFEPSAGDLNVILVQLGKASGIEYEVGGAADRAALQVSFVDVQPLTAGDRGRVTLEVRNTGAQPAYRVIARLRSSSEALHNVQLSFGRIDPGKVGRRSREISLPDTVDYREPMVVAVATASNAAAAISRQPYKINARGAARPQTLLLGCTPATAQLAPGEPVRVDCTLKNTGTIAVQSLTARLELGGVLAQSVRQWPLVAGAAVKLVLVGSPPRSAQQARAIRVVVRVTGTDAHVESRHNLPFANPDNNCPNGMLTRREYETKRRKLEAELKAKNLTPDEFNTYDAELVTCMQ